MLLARRAVIGLVFAALGNSAFAAGNPVVEMSIEKRGTVVIELFQKDAPKTVEHFMDLVKKGFYNGILVHRVVPGFVVQAGDPKTKTGGVDAPGVGSGGSGKNIPFESNRQANKTGTIAMALSAPHSATGDSQWFINTADNDRLNGDYCVFGKVIKGMDVVMKVQKGDKIVSIKPRKK